jgi:small subunit ribosomal protein S2
MAEETRTLPREDESPEASRKGELLVPEDLYLTSGVHIGTQQKTADMRPYIYRVRNDGLYVLDIHATDRRVRDAASLVARADAARVLVVSARQYGQKPAREFAKHVGAMAIVGRFMPGTLTNPNTPNFIEPDVLLLTDPLGDAQALREAVNVGIPVIGLADSNNELKNIDLAIPTNNKGRRSLAFVYWLLTRETLKAQGRIKSDDEYTLSVEDFEASL